MARAAFSVDLSGLNTLSLKIRGVLILVTDFTEEWTEVSLELMAHFEEVFRLEGPGWQALTAATRKDRADEGFGAGHPILYRTGSFAESFISNAEINSEPMSLIFRSTDDRAEELVAKRRVVREKPVMEAVEAGFMKSFASRFEDVWEVKSG